jgi:putative ABC transport system ATP-binding protein
VQKGRAEKMVLTRAVPDLQSGETTLSKATTLPETIASRKPLIQLRQVVKAYQTAAGDFLALKGISTEIYQGEFLGIIGKSGAGKSTFLNMVTGVDHLTSGEVWVTGEDGKPPVSIHTLNENALAFWRGRTVGVIYQSFQLLPMLTLLDNILLPMDLCGDFRNGQSRRRALELLKLVELEDHAYKLPSQVSGGQQQRAAIARALANDPPILVADEPTGSLDSVTADAIFQVFENLIAAGKTILMVTHDNALGPRFTRRLYLADGELAPAPETAAPLLG